MNFEFLISNENMIRYIQCFIYGMLVMFIISSCKTTTPRLPDKLNLEDEKKIISEASDIPEAKKRFILDTFEKSENYCNNIILTMNDLYKVIEEQKKEIKTLDEQARIYRTARNWLIGSISFLLIGLLFWTFKDSIIPIAKKFLGIPI